MKHFVLLFATVALTAGSTYAESVLPLNNASFENQNAFDQNAGCNTANNCYNYSIISWNISGSQTAGTFDPSPPFAIGATPPALSGNNVAFIQSGFISQDLGTLTSGDQYAVTVAVAGRNSSSPTSRIGVSLGSSASPTFTDFFQTSLVTSASIWQIQTLHFTANSTGNWFFFVANDGPGQLLVDAVAEPNSLLLIGIGLTCVGLLKRMTHNA